MGKECGRPFRWPRGIRRGSAASRFLGLRVRIPLEVRMSSPWVSCVLSGRGLRGRPIPRPEQSYLVCVCLCQKV